MNSPAQRERLDKQRAMNAKNLAITKWLSNRGINFVKIYRGRAKAATDHIKLIFHVGNKEHTISVLRKRSLGANVDNIAQAKVMVILGGTCTHRRTKSGSRYLTTRTCIDCGKAINKVDWLGLETPPQTETEKLIIQHLAKGE
ncbi:MAG: hypothetical protein COA78_12070 [Blastopirellula sp.]|nr:MAG: hypothetical protein COA78_12070 [Blastopirellula sp.]